MSGDMGDEDEADDPTRAFEELRRAVEALPRVLAESQPPAPPDYRADVGKVALELEAVVGRLAAIEKHPALRLTPEAYSQAILRAGSAVMSEAMGKLEKAAQGHERAKDQLAGMIGSVRGKRNQAFWLITLSVMAFLLTLLASPIILSELPFGWNTNAAAQVMDNDRWGAGWALLRISDPNSAQDAAAGLNLVQVNRSALIACQEAAAKSGKSKPCIVTVKTSP